MISLEELKRNYKQNKSINQISTKQSTPSLSDLKKNYISNMSPTTTQMPTNTAFNILNSASKAQSYDDMVKKNNTPVLGYLNNKEIAGPIAPSQELVNSIKQNEEYNKYADKIREYNQNVEKEKKAAADKYSWSNWEGANGRLAQKLGNTIAFGAFSNNAQNSVEEENKKEFAATAQEMYDDLLKNKEQRIVEMGEDNYYSLINQITPLTPMQGNVFNALGSEVEYGNLQVKSSLAWKDYIDSGKEEDKIKAEQLDEQMQKYMLENPDVGKTIVSDTAQYLPQFGYQLQNNAIPVALSLATNYGVNKFTGNKQAAQKASQGVYALGSTITGAKASYDLAQGGIYRDLVKMGVPDEKAREISADSAFWQTVIESGENIYSLKDIFNVSTNNPVKQRVKDYLKAYGVNILTEAGEEGTQELIGMAYEKKALDESGLDSSEYTLQNALKRASESALAGGKIALTMGVGDTAVNVTMNEIPNVQSRTDMQSSKNDIKKSIEQSFDNAIAEAKRKNNTELVTKLQKQKQKSTTSEAINQAYETIKEFSQNAQQPVQSITPQSPNTQIQQQTNEVIPQQNENQQNANVVKNNTNNQNVDKRPTLDLRKIAQSYIKEGNISEQDKQILRETIDSATDEEIDGNLLYGLRNTIKEQEQKNTLYRQNNTQIVQNTPNNVQISQNNAQNAQDLQKTVQNDTERFSQQVEQWKNNKWDTTKDLVVLEHTPQIYQDLGLRDLAITVNPEKLTSIYYSEGRGKKNFHGLKEIVKQIPEALKRPLNIVESNTRDNSIIVITDLADKNGNIITVPISIDDQGNLSIEEFFNGEAVNKMSSAYGRENYDYNVSKKGNYYDGWMQENLKNNRIVYDIDEGIIKKRVNGRWLQLPNAVDSLNIGNDVLDNNIIQSNENYVNNQQINLPTQAEQQQAQQELRDKLLTQEKQQTGKKTKSLTDIADLTEEDVKMPKGKYKALKDKNTNNTRKFYENVETSKIISNKVKELVEPTTYEQQKNIDVLARVQEKLDKQGNSLINEWYSKDIKKATEEDVALGAVLIERYQQQGDYNSAVNVVQKLADIGTEAGRTVQMYSIFQRLAPESMLIYQQKKLNNAFEELSKKQTGEWVKKNKDKFKLTEDDAQFIEAKVQEAQNTPTERQKQIALAEIESRINDKLPPEAGQSVKAFRRIAMLFNPKTQVRNIAGNITVMPLNYVTDLVGTAIDKAIAKKTGVRTTALPNLKTIGKGFKKGASETIDDYRRGIRTTPTGNRYEIESRPKSFNENTNSKLKNAINKKLNGIDRILSTVLELGDRPFYEAAYQNALETQMKANKVTEPTQEMIDIASNVALSQTWQDSNNYTQAVLGIRSAFNKVNIKGFGLGDLIIPFAKTPANLTKAMVEYSPVGFIPALINYNNMSKAISRGDMTAMQQKKFVTSVGKAIAGTILYTIAGALVKGGTITGSADDDKDVANFEKNVLGIQPYSIKIGDKTFTYNWAQPLATPFAIMADTYKMSEEGAEWNEILVNAFKVAGDQLVANSFLQGIQELLSSEYGNESAMDNLVGALMDLPTQFTPTLFGQIATQFDSTKRQTFENGDTVGTMVNEVMNKLPGAKNTLAPQVNTFGEEIQNYGGDNNPFNVFLNPGNISSTNASETQKELYKLYQDTKDKTIFPVQAPYSLSGGGEKVTLSSKDRADYQKTSGKFVSENLEALFNSEYYKSLDNDKKAEVVNAIVTDANTLAKGEYLPTKATQELNEKIDKLGDIPVIEYYKAWSATRDIKADKNWKGETISGSKKSKQIQAVNNAVSKDLTKQQRETLYGLVGISGY